MAGYNPDMCKLEDECGVCKEPYQNVQLFPCLHFTHAECIQTSFLVTGRNECPYCRGYVHEMLHLILDTPSGTPQNPIIIE